MATPEYWENATPIYGIRYPKPTAPAQFLPDMFQHTGVDVESALQLAQIPPVTPAPVMVAATAAARDAFWGVPTTDAARLTLQNRGATTIRTDKGWTERYFAVKSGSNPGGADFAGWYPLDSGWIAYTPTFRTVGAGASPPVLGNSTFAAHYRTFGPGLMSLMLFLSCGSTGWSGGVGSWEFTMPTGFVGLGTVEQIGSAKCYVGGSANFIGGVVFPNAPSNTVFYPVMPLSGAASNTDRVRNSSGGTNTGVPNVGTYPFIGGSNMTIAATVEVTPSAAPAFG